MGSAGRATQPVKSPGKGKVSDNFVRAGGMNNSIRFKLTDKGGTIRFDAFEVVAGVLACDVVVDLREFLVGKALADITYDELFSRFGRRVELQQLDDLYRLIENYRTFFSDGRKKPPATLLPESVRIRRNDAK